MRRNNFFDKISLSMDLPSEPIPRQPVVELFGCSRVLIENHLGITQYCNDEICIKVHFGLLRISGENLHIVRMSDCRIIICGRIDSIQTQRGRKNGDP